MLRSIRVLMLLGAALSAPLYAETLYASDGGAAGTLYTLNPANGSVVTSIAAGEGFTGLDFHPGTGVMYGATGGAAGSELFTLDPVSGAASLIADMTAVITDISFRSNGVLYGVTRDNILVTIDLLTAVHSAIGSFTSGTPGGGLAFDSSDTLYYAGTSLLILDPSNAGSTLVGVIQRTRALAFDSQDVLYMASTTNALYQVNTGTGATTLMGASVAGLDALAFYDVPEPSTWISLSLGLLGIAGLRRLRKITG